MFYKLIVQTAGTVLAIFAAAKFVPGVEFFGGYEMLALAGLLFAILYAIIAPILKAITFPLRVLTFNLFSLVIDMAALWTVDVLVPEIKIIGLLPLLITTIMILVINAILWQILSPSLK